MRRFYILGHPPEQEVGKAVTLRFHDWGGFDYLRLMRGVPVGAIPDGVKMLINEPPSIAANANVLVCPFGWKIFSGDLANRLMAVASNDVEIIEVPLGSLEGNSLPKKFFAINALRVLDALSDKRTVRSSIALGDERPVLKPFIVSSRVPKNVHVFRLRGDENRLLVDCAAKDALSALPHDGLAFISVESE